MLKKVIFITGPTAVGKSDIAIDVAEKVNGEIISCDSMQVYREIAIASNKVSLSDQKRVKHHVLDVTSVYEKFDVVQYVCLAKEAIRVLIESNKIPVVVGGSGLYLDALLDGIFEGPKADQDYRRTLEAEVKEKGNQYIYQKLQDVDKESANNIHPNDIRRVIRALEVYNLSGRTMSEWKVKRKGLQDQYDVRQYVLNRNRTSLYRSIDMRVDNMMDRGLLEEIKSLDRGRLSTTSRYLIGIKELSLMLKGDVSLENAVDDVKKNTRHYAKRQLTWFRKDARYEWIDLDNQESKNIVDRLCR